MRVLLTGASGFIGRTTAELLRSSGCEVVGLVHSSAAPTAVAHVVQATLGSDDAVETILTNCDRCEAIVHAAACINYDKFCPALIHVNCAGTQQVLAVAQEWRVKTFVNISGITVLGRPLEHPITEEHPTAPRTTYHATKLFAEHLLASASMPQLAGVSLRVTAPVGPGMPAGGILPVFVRNAIQNRPLPLSGRGTRVQNYVDVRDIAEAIVGCLGLRPTGVFNLGGPSTLSNLELAKSCIRVLSSSSTTGFTGAPDPADDDVWDVSSDAAKVAFQYQPIHDIESSIKAVGHEHESSPDERHSR